MHTGRRPRSRVLAGAGASVAHVEPDACRPSSMVAAVDAGSTMLAARLLDPGTGSLLAGGQCLNPQTRRGADVLSRIAYARDVKGGLQELRSLLAAGIRDLLEALCGALGAGLDRLDAAVVAGNTTMLHLLCGLSPASMGTYPYTPADLFGREENGLELDLGADFEVWLPPCVSAFVGGDIVCGLLALSEARPGEDLALMDLGTNGEMAIWRNGRIVCASAAAGPVFEGGGVRCGMPALEGAVERVWPAEGGFRVRTVGGAPPRGICGSGLVDAVARFLEAGILDETGALDEDMCEQGPEDDGPSVVLAGDVLVTQGDVRRFQTAKAAVAAGFSVLESETGGCPDLHLGGGLGSSLPEESARRVGLVPSGVRLCAAGNTSLEGAALLALDPALRARTRHIRDSCRVVDLAAHPDFAQQYVERMLFDSEEDET